MKKIRTFIVGSSLFLFAWLAASYTHELNHTDAIDINDASVVDSAAPALPAAPTAPVVGIPATESTKDQLPATASLIGAN